MSSGPWRAPGKPSGSAPGQQAEERCHVIPIPSFHLVLHDIASLFTVLIASSFCLTDATRRMDKQLRTLKHKGSEGVFA